MKNIRPKTVVEIVEEILNVETGETLFVSGEFVRVLYKDEEEYAVEKIDRTLTFLIKETQFKELPNQEYWQ